ncbi:hypothetical protein RRG08_031734 [Elysia crispata]|uniref:Uncharacterized protein n=1 Tax=Elysia crispata TaxID=231223 RepID=A0AAE0ZF23_9GAST|nr:hypothetical protein RRG08_031734 [Elysia crispata]
MQLERGSLLQKEWTKRHQSFEQFVASNLLLYFTKNQPWYKVITKHVMTKRKRRLTRLRRRRRAKKRSQKTEVVNVRNGVALQAVDPGVARQHQPDLAVAPTPPLPVAQAQEAQVLVALPDQGAQAQADPQALAAATAEAEVVEKKSRGQKLPNARNAALHQNLPKFMLVT